MSGYDIEKFEPPPDPELVCCICTFVLDQPMESPCQHVFCKHCIETWLQQRRNCPTCRKKMSKRHLKPVLPLVQNMLNKLAMVCDFRDNGCEEKPTLELYRSHIAKCDYEMLTCKFKSCQAQVLRRDIAVHETNLCEFREVLCLRQCGLQLPIRDINSHDCMQALKKHAEERRKHAEDLEARLKSLMSLQQSLREDVDQLRRQVEEERRRREEQQPWSPSFYSSSNWTTDNEDNEEHTTAEILDSDTDSDSDHTLRSTEHNRSGDQALSDSDVEFTDNRQPTPALSVSSNNSDVEIVPPTIPEADIERDIDGTFEEEPDEDVDDENEGEDEEIITIQANNTFDVDGTNASTSLLNLDMTQSPEELVHQIIDCFGKLENSNVTNPTIDMMCKYASKVMSSFVKMIQIVRHSARDTSLQAGSSTDTSQQAGSTSDTSGMLDSTGNALSTSVVTESDIFEPTSPSLNESGSTENVYDRSTTDTAQLIDPMIQRLMARYGSAFDSARFQEMTSSSSSQLKQHNPQHKPACLPFKDKEATSTNHLVPDTQDESPPMRFDPQNEFRSDDLDELLASVYPPSEKSVTDKCEDTYICISSTDDLEEAVNKKDVGYQEEHSGVYVDVAEDPELIPSTLQQSCKSNVETIPSSVFNVERQKRQHSQLDNSNSEFSKKMKIGLCSTNADSRASVLLCNSYQKTKERSTLPAGTSLVRGPVSCTVTSETVSSECTPSVFTNYPESSPQPESTVQPAPKVRQGRRIHFPEPPGQTREIVDVPVPRGTAQLLEEFSGDSDSSWEPGNSEEELETEEISSSHDEESRDSF